LRPHNAPPTTDPATSTVLSDSHDARGMGHAVLGSADGHVVVLDYVSGTKETQRIRSGNLHDQMIPQ
jgi:hypothetical protein